MRPRSDPVFAGTGVPIQALLDWLDQGETVTEFLRYFPSVSREQALAAIAEAGSRPHRRPARATNAPPA